MHAKYQNLSTKSKKINNAIITLFKNDNLDIVG